MARSRAKAATDFMHSREQAMTIPIESDRFTLTAADLGCTKLLSNGTELQMHGRIW